MRVPLRQIAALSQRHRIVITHGNAPQIGNLLLQQEQETKRFVKRRLEVLVAETQGQIGYMIEQTLDNELMRIGINKPLISTVLTYVLVDRNDPAFRNPTKPIGPAFKRKRKWCALTPKGWRRIVPSPQPIKIIEWREIKTLVKAGFIVIACGGGGIPVTTERKHFEGIEAVIDKDLASARLGQQIGADLLVIATEVDRVALNFGKPSETYIDRCTVAEAKRYLDEGHFPAGSMGPKVQAAVNFVTDPAKLAIITSIDKIDSGLKGRAGTRITFE
jgi:carbamate kinase